MMSAAEKKYKDDFWTFARKQKNKLQLEELGVEAYLDAKEYDKQKYISETGVMEPTVTEIYRRYWDGLTFKVLPDPTPDFVWINKP